MGIGGFFKKVGRAIDPTTKRGLANLATGGMYEMNNQLTGGKLGEMTGFMGKGTESAMGLAGAQKKATEDVDFMRDYGGKVAGNIEGHDFESAAKRAAASLAGPYDQQVADDAYAQQVEPIEQAKFTAARGAADAYSRRGLGASGMAAGAQGDVALQAAAQKRQARLASIDKARDVTRTRALDTYGVESGGNDAYLKQQLAMMGVQGQGRGGSIDILNALAAIKASQDAAKAQKDAALGGALGTAGGMGLAAILSDERAKTNIKRLDEEAMPGVQFAEFEYRHDPGVKRVGVIAQDVARVRPELVTTRPDGYLAVDYSFLGRE
jgi:hypothetical protein